MGVKSFTLYEEYFDLISLLPRSEQKDLILGIVEYMFQDKEPKLNERQNKIFTNLKRPLDISKQRRKVSSNSKSNKNQKEIKIKSNENQKEITSNDVYVYVNVNVNNIIKEVIDYLNLKTNKKYKYNTSNTVKHIKARLNEGYILEDFKKVIDTKCLEWLNDKKMNQYLRPDTLFGTKFESYFNQKPRELTTRDLASKIDIGEVLRKGARK